MLLPLAMPGLMSGGFAPRIHGRAWLLHHTGARRGAEDQMISSIIAFFATGTANWSMAGALGLILLVVTTLLYFLYGRLSRSPTMIGP